MPSFRPACRGIQVCFRTQTQPVVHGDDGPVSHRPQRCAQQSDADIIGPDGRPAPLRWLYAGQMQVSGSGSLCGTSFFYLHFRQIVVGKLEVVCYLLPLFVIGIGSIRKLVVSIRVHVFIVHYDDLHKQFLQS